jgi:hypothetical protein
MTHMWPNMARKPLSTLSRGIDLDWDDDEHLNDDETTQPSAEFPVSFNLSADSSSTTHAQAGTGTDNQDDDFPGLDELKSQIMLEDLELRHNTSGGQMMDRLGFSRLDMMDDDFDDGDGGDWVEAEYAKLDDWLEEDDDEGQGQGEGGSRDEEGVVTENQNDHNHKHDQLQGMNHTQSAQPEQEESQFEDDFADFAPFQSGPHPHPVAATATGPGSASLDPTPLLLHLQNVREELAGMDEDTRRVRAGREVESVLKSLGLAGLDWDDDGDDDMVRAIGGIPKKPME